VLLRGAVDSITGNLSDSRARYLGTKPINLVKVVIQGLPAMIALSSRPWFCYNFMSKYSVTPLSYEPIQCASRFSSDGCPDAFVGVLDNSLRIFTVSELGEMFNQKTINLRYTVREMHCDLDMQKIITIETDHCTYDTKTRELIRNQVFDATKDEEYSKTQEKFIGYPKARAGIWGSCIRIIDVVKMETFDVFELDLNEAAFSMLVTDKLGTGDQKHVVVGTGKEMTLHPKT
jgi:splicing factor 3B subunit 3